MRKLTVLIYLFAAACTQLVPTPYDFPPPPGTVIVEFPNNTPEPRFVPLPYPIASGDMVEAEAFLLRLQTNAVAGNADGIAESVFYPINVTVNGQTVSLTSSDEFIQNYNQVFNDKILTALSETATDALMSGAEGISIGDGELWFNLFCMDAACAQREFLITQINN